MRPDTSFGVRNAPKGAGRQLARIMHRRLADVA